jgi:PilZ domain-containing protein
MSDHRPDPRVPTDLSVRIWGMAANNQTFTQHVRARNISSSGALFSGLEHELKVGDVIGVQYGDRKSRCRVIWIMDAGPVQKMQVGVQIVTDQDCPWKGELKPEQLAAPIEPNNRRRFTRHRISFPLELRDERVKTPMRVNATDVSGNGCYVETILPLAVGITLRVEFWVNEEKISTSAVVRTSDPGVGNGIEFMGLTPDTKKRLQDHLDSIDPQRANTFERNASE